jgi:predicted dehydrogenase
MNNDSVIIGDGKHSREIKKFLKKKIKFDIFKPKNKNKITEKEVNFLKRYRVIFILTPNSSHYQYINKLNDYKRYIFCEKPPTNNICQLKKIEKMRKGKLYFNFNYRFSEIANCLNNKKIFNKKELISSIINVSHNYALKKEYRYNWRSKKFKCPFGIKEMVTVHWIDLINYLFGIKKILNTEERNISKNGNTNDTANIFIKTKNNATVSIFNSYSSSFIFNLLFIFKDRHLEFNGKEIKIYQTYLKKNSIKRTVGPRLIKRIKVGKNINGLEQSLIFFLKKVRQKKEIPDKAFNLSINSNKFIFTN